MAKKRRKKLERTKLREECLALAKTIAKTRDGYVCQKCGERSAAKGHKIDGSHVFAVGGNSAVLAVDPINIKALCFECHQWFGGNPTESGDWFRETFPKRMEYLDWQKVVTKSYGTIPIQ